MKLAHCVIPVLFVASSVIQDADGEHHAQQPIEVVYHNQTAPVEAVVPVRSPRRALVREGGLVPDLAPILAPRRCPRIAHACTHGALDNGYLDARFLIKIYKIPKGSSCCCCVLCRQDTRCFSQAFNWRTRECRLYKAVASYTTFTQNDDWKYMICRSSKMRSQHEQFCRRDSDCLTAGDACRGRVCTNERAVVCSTIYDVYMRRGKSGEGLGDDIINTYGWIDGKEKRIACMLNSLSPGYTLLFRNHEHFKFNDNSIRHYNRYLKDEVVPYSDLALAERLRKLTRGGSYRLQVFSTARDSAEPVSLLQLDVPKQHEVIGSMPRPASTHNVKIRDLGCEKVNRRYLRVVSLPYLARVYGPYQGTGKNKRNGLLSMHNGGAGWGQLGLAQSDGAIDLFDSGRGDCALLMRE